MSSSSETYVNSDDGSISEEFHKHFWKYAIGGIIVILLGLMAYKIINVLLNNPLTSAINDLVGDAGLLLSDFTQGCCKQSDCPNIHTKDECESGCGCGWDDKAGNCGSTTGATVGSGGPYTLSCPLFFTLIIGAGAWLLVKIVGGIYSVFKDRQSTKDLNATALLTSQPPDELARKIGNGTRLDYEDWRKEAERKGKKYTIAEERYMANRIAQIKFNQDVVEPLKTRDKNKWAAADQNAREQYKNLIDSLGQDVDTDRLDGEAEEYAGKDPVPHGEG